MATPEQKRKTEQLVNAIDEDREAEALALIADPTVDINNNFDENDEELLPPLITAAQYEDGPILDALLARPDIDLNKATSEGLTALMTAVDSGLVDVVQKLLNSGKPINVNLIDEANKTALDHAEALNPRYAPDKLAIIQALKDKGANNGDERAIIADQGPTPQKSDYVNDALLKTRRGELPIETMVEIIKGIQPGQLNIRGTKNDNGPGRPPQYFTPVQYLFERVSGIDKAVYKAVFDRDDFNPNMLFDDNYSTPLTIIISNARHASDSSDKVFAVMDLLLNHPRMDVNFVIERGARGRDTALDRAERYMIEARNVRRFKQLIVDKLKAKGAKRANEVPAPGAAAGQGAPPGAAAGQGVPPGAAAPVVAVPMWQGYSESDLSLVNSMFDVDESSSSQREALIQSKIQNFSMCPVCLRVVIRSDACMFMSHECSPPYHRELYNKYSYTSARNNKTYIEWCTICGRICENHRHYSIGKASGGIPGFTTKNAITNANAFGTDCKKLGGGGIEEKFMRIQRMIDTVCELQTQVGKISEQDARNRLTEAIWDSAIDEPDPVFLVEVMEKGKFRLDEKCKSILNKPIAQKETTYADVERPADEKQLTPIKYDNVSEIPYSEATRALRVAANGMSSASSQKEAAEAAAKAAEDEEKENYCGPELGVHEDDRPTYGFRHKQPDGKVINHGTIKEDGLYTERYCGEHLEELLRSLNLQDTKGKCPLSETCKAKLYPEEIKGIVSNEYYENYKRIFNEVNTPQKGGADIPPIFGTITDVEGICPLPQKAGKKRRTRRAKKARKTRKRAVV